MEKSLIMAILIFVSGLFVLTKLDFDISLIKSQLVETNQKLLNWVPASSLPTQIDMEDQPDSSTL